MGHQLGIKSYELIELKIGDYADTPLRAAFQILKYGMLYFFARLNKHRLNVPHQTGVLAAQFIELKVLAPLSNYENLKLSWLAELLTKGLEKFCNDHFGNSLIATFSFESFASDFRWPAQRRDLLHYLAEREKYQQ